MAGNTAPIFSRNGNIGMNNQALGITSYRSSDYTGATATVNQLIFTSDPTNQMTLKKGNKHHKESKQSSIIFCVSPM